MPLEFNLSIFGGLQMGHSTFKWIVLYFVNEMPILFKEFSFDLTVWAQYIKEEVDPDTELD